MDAEPPPAAHTPVLYVAPLLALGLMLSLEMVLWRSGMGATEYLMISGGKVCNTMAYHDISV